MLTNDRIGIVFEVVMHGELTIQDQVPELRLAVGMSVVQTGWNEVTHGSMSLNQTPPPLD
jgi:hypothetical protein